MNKPLKVITLTVVLAAGLNAADRIAGGNGNQGQRISQGVACGQLTVREPVSLEARERLLRRQIRRDRIDGGGLTIRERYGIECQQDALSRDIYLQKHDLQRRW